jgi:transcriptional regulator with XRE-family HTH domain
MKDELKHNVNSVSSLKSLSGLTTGQIARLFGVSSRMIDRWIKGTPMSTYNKDRLLTLLSVVKSFPGTSEDRRRVLLRSSSGMSIFHQQVKLVTTDQQLQFEFQGGTQ